MRIYVHICALFSMPVFTHNPLYPPHQVGYDLSRAAADDVFKKTGELKQNDCHISYSCFM